MVHSEHQDRVVLTDLERLQCEIQCGRAAGAGVVHVVDGAPVRMQFTQCTLPRQHGPERVAAVERLYVGESRAGIFQSVKNGRLDHGLFGELRKAAEVGDAHAGDHWWLHFIAPGKRSRVCRPAMRRAPRARGFRSQAGFHRTGADRKRERPTRSRPSPVRRRACPCRDGPP
ncbi:hypothetical protein D3C85_1442480 [compost metagenome]